MANREQVEIEREQVELRVIGDPEPAEEAWGEAERVRLDRANQPGTFEYSVAQGYLAQLKPCDVLSVYAPAERYPEDCWRSDRDGERYQPEALLEYALDTIWSEVDRDDAPPPVRRALDEEADRLMNFDAGPRAACIRDGRLAFVEDYDLYDNEYLKAYDEIVRLGVSLHSTDREVIEADAEFDRAVEEEDRAQAALAAIPAVHPRELGQGWWMQYPPELRAEYLEAQSRAFESFRVYNETLCRKIREAIPLASLAFVHARTDLYPRRKRRERRVRMPSLREHIVVGTSRLDQGVSLNFCRLRSWQVDTQTNVAVMHHEGEQRRFRVTSYLPVPVWETLREKPAIVVKAWHVFEAIRFESGDPLGPFPITPERIMREIKGHTRTKYLPHEKKEAADLVDGIVQLECAFHWQDHAKRMHRTRGPLYLRCLRDETFEDLFDWVPNAMLIQVNPALYDRRGTDFARQYAPYHRTFLSLNAQKDAAAIFLGSYILLKGRPQSSQFEAGECRVRNKTLVKVLVETGQLDVRGMIAARQMAQIRKKVERDLDKLQSVGLIRGWDTVDLHAADLDEGTLEEIEDVSRAFPDELPRMVVRRSRPGAHFEGAPQRLSAGTFWHWLHATTRIQLSDIAYEAQVAGRAALMARKGGGARSRRGGGRIA